MILPLPRRTRGLRRAGPSPGRFPALSLASCSRQSTPLAPASQMGLPPPTRAGWGCSDAPGDGAGSWEGAAGSSLWTHLSGPASGGTRKVATQPAWATGARRPPGPPPAVLVGAPGLHGGADGKRQRNRLCGTPEPADQASQGAAAQGLGGREVVRSHRLPPEGPGGSRSAGGGPAGA